MAILTLTPAQSQFMTSLETPFLDAFGDGIILPGGNPAVLPGFKGFKDYTDEVKTNALNGIKSTFAPFVQGLLRAPTYATITSFTNGFALWGDGRYGGGVLQYEKDALGYVRVHGLIKTPDSGATIGLTAFTLPAGFIPGPNDRRIFPCVADNLFCAVEVDDGGGVTLRSLPANSTWVSLEFSFYAGG